MSELDDRVSKIDKRVGDIEAWLNQELPDHLSTEQLQVARRLSVGAAANPTGATLQIAGEVALQPIAASVQGQVSDHSALLWNDGTWLHVNEDRDGEPLLTGIQTAAQFAAGSLSVGRGSDAPDPGAGNLWVRRTLAVGTVPGENLATHSFPADHQLYVEGDTHLAMFRSTGDTGYIRLVTKAGEVEFGNGAGGELVLWTTNHDALVIDQGGNVQIGRDNPTAKLTVNDLTVGGHLTVAGNVGHGDDKLETPVVTIDGPLVVDFCISTSGHRDNGNLHIAGDGVLYLMNKGGTVVSKSWGGNGNLTVAGNLTIDGNLTGAGTLNMEDEVVLGATRTSVRGFDPGGMHKIRTDGKDNEIWMVFKQTDTDYQENVNRHDNILGVDYTESVQQHIGRSIQFAVPTVGLEVYQQSDERLKTSICSLNSALAGLERIRGVSFRWEHSTDVPGNKQRPPSIGVVAQEVEAVFPELVVTHGEQGYKAVNYSGLTAVLIEAIKELKAANEALQQRVVRLEKG